MKAHVLVFIATAFSVLPLACNAADPVPFEVECKEPLPEFTLGEKSHPTKDQEAALCTCIWNGLDQPDRVLSEKILRNDLNVNPSEVQNYSGRFGDVLEKCGGLKL
jgi:hypothetical protein